MAQYKYPQVLQPNNSNAFDLVHNPGSSTPFSGIYRCAGCGREATSIQHHPLPPQNHHQHSLVQGHVRWQLIVSES